MCSSYFIRTDTGQCMKMSCEFIIIIYLSKHFANASLLAFTECCLCCVSLLRSRDAGKRCLCCGNSVFVTNRCCRLRAAATKPICIVSTSRSSLLIKSATSNKSVRCTCKHRCNIHTSSAL